MKRIFIVVDGPRKKKNFDCVDFIAFVIILTFIEYSRERISEYNYEAHVPIETGPGMASGSSITLCQFLILTRASMNLQLVLLS